MSPVCRGAWLMFGVMRGRMWSPVSSTLRASSKKHTWPGVWPGVQHRSTRLVPGPAAARRRPGTGPAAGELAEVVGRGRAGTWTASKSAASPPRLRSASSLAAGSRRGWRTSPCVRGVGLVHRDPRPGALAQSPGEAHVVTVAVGDEDRLDVAEVVAGLVQSRAPGRPTTSRTASRCPRARSRRRARWRRPGRSAAGCWGTASGSTRGRGGPSRPGAARGRSMPAAAACRSR